MISKIDYFKTKLLEEKEKLEQDLKTMAKRNPENPDDWEPAPPPLPIARESKAAKPSDNMLGKECAQRTRLQRAVNADVASLHASHGPFNCRGGLNDYGQASPFLLLLLA